MKKRSFHNILDAGCGPGLFSFYVAEKFPNGQIKGYDISSDNIDMCNESKISENIHNVTFKQIDLKTLNEMENYDFIFSIDVMEHISGNKRVFKNIYNALEFGGTFYLAMPYEPGHQYIISRNRFKKYVDWAKKEHIGEQYSLNSITKVLSEIGFNVVDTRYTFGLWGKLAWEFDMLTDEHLTVKHSLQPLLFTWGYIDTLWRNGAGSYAIRVIAGK